MENTEPSPDARVRNLSYDVRVLLCPACGAAYESTPKAGMATCEHCGAHHQLLDRDERREVVGDRVDADESRRLSLLRKQPSGALVVPKRFVTLVNKPDYDDADRETIAVAWKEAYDALRAGNGNDGFELVLYSATWLQFTTQAKATPTSRRARAESALEVLKTPKYRHILRCKLAGAAARQHELEAAEGWIAPCDARSSDLIADSEYRAARALMALRRERFDEVLTVLGHRPGEVPLHDSFSTWLGLLRAQAHEKLGDLEHATDQLAVLVSKDVKALDRMLSRDDMVGFCEKSLPAARERIAAIDASCFDVSFPEVMCDRCGAEVEIKATATEVRCPYCDTISAIALRPMIQNFDAFAGTVPGANDIPPERRKKLAGQVVGWSVPDDVAPLIDNGLLKRECVEQAEALWRKDVRALVGGDETKERAFHLLLLTVSLVTAGFGNDLSARRRMRALVETTLRVMRDPNHAQRLRCTIAGAAAENGDYEAAATWLSRCDARSDDLGAFSSYVMARARIASRRGDFAEVVRMLGTREEETPMSLQLRVTAAILRAAALERLDRRVDAVAAIVPILKWSADARVALERFVAEMHGDGEPAPVESLERAIALVAQQRTTRWLVIAALLVAVVALYLILRR